MNILSNKILLSLKNFFHIGIIQSSVILFHFILMPMIIRRCGLNVFGQFTLAMSYAYFLSTLVNYGTNQTSLVDISLNKADRNKISFIFWNTLWIRTSVLLIIVLAFTLFYLSLYLYSGNLFLLKIVKLNFFISIIPIILSELVSPYYILLAFNKTSWYSSFSIFSRLFSILLIYIFITNGDPVYRINYLVGFPAFFVNFFLCILVIKKYRIFYFHHSLKYILRQLKSNFYVTVNGSSVYFQQSFYLFLLSHNQSSNFLGAFGIIDKIQGFTRQLISSLSNAFFPQYAEIFLKGIGEWINLKRRVQFYFFISTCTVGILIYFMSDFISLLIIGSPNYDVSLFLKLFSFVPLLISLNSSNVIELLLLKKHLELFQISLILILCTVIISVISTNSGNIITIGLYPLFIEGICLGVYFLYIKKN